MLIVYSSQELGAVLNFCFKKFWCRRTKTTVILPTFANDDDIKMSTIPLESLFSVEKDGSNDITDKKTDS